MLLLLRFGKRLFYRKRATERLTALLILLVIDCSSTIFLSRYRGCIKIVMISGVQGQVICCGRRGLNRTSFLAQHSLVMGVRANRVLFTVLLMIVDHGAAWTHLAV